MIGHARPLPTYLVPVAHSWTVPRLHPLVGFLVPSIAIAYGIVLPRNGVTGVNELSVGFATTLLGAAVTYIIGVAVAVRR
jgi:hypothetical protein